VPVDLSRFAKLLRERSTEIVERFMSAWRDEPAWNGTSPQARDFLRELCRQTIESMAVYLESGRMPAPDQVGAVTESLANMEIPLAMAGAGKELLGHEVIRTLAEAEGSREDLCAAIGAAQHVLEAGLRHHLQFAERQFHSDQAELLSSLDSFGVVIFRADAGARVLSVNESGARCLGAASAQDVVGRNFGEFYADPAERERLLAEIRKKGEVQHFRFQLRRLDGQVRWCETNMRTVRGPDGQFLGFEGFARDVNAIVETEDRQAKLMASLDAMAVVVFRADAESRILTVNRAGATVLGAASPGELVGKTFASFYADPEERAKLREQIAASGEINRFRFRLRRLDGQLRWAETNMRAVTDPEGELLGFDGFARDITDQVETEGALQRSEERYRELVENLNDVVYTANAAGVLTYLSPSCRNLLGYEPEELVGKPYTDFIHPEDVRGLREDFRLTISGDLHPAEFRVLTKSGEVRWVRSSSRPIMAGDRPAGLRGVVSDITDRVKAAQALQGSEARYRELIENLTDAIYSVDASGVLTYFSPVVESIAGYRPEEVVGQPFAKFIHADDLPLVAEEFGKGLAGDVKPSSFRIVAKSGETRWVRTTTRPAIEAGRPVGLRGMLSDITPLVEAEKALEAERLRLEHVVRSLGAGLSLIDRDMRIVWVNEHLNHWFGPNEKLLGQPCYKAYQGRDCPCEGCPAIRTMATGEQCTHDVVTPASLGGRTYRLTTTPVCDEKGAIVQVLELVQDVTEELAAEAENARTASMLAGILSSAGEYAIVATDPAGTITYFSEGAEQLFGVKQAGPVGRINIADLWPPDARAAFAAALEALARGGRYEEDAELLRAQGLTFTARVSGSARLDAAGVLAGFTFVIRDVTEERAAQKLVTLLAHAVESSREGIVLTDMSGVITYVNPAIAAMAGRGAGEVLGKDISLLYSRETPGEEIRAIARSTLAGGWNGEVTAVRADGSTYPAYLTTSLVRDERGRAVAMVGLWRDISREKSLQRRLFEQEQRHLSELERQVRERTAELERAYRDLQKLDAMKDRFLTNVSHELRTPLVSGVGYIELILHEGLGPINEEIRKGLRVAHRNLLRLVNLIDDLLTFTRLGSGKESMVMSRFDLGQLVNDCLLDLKVRASKKGLRVEMDVEKGLPPVEADEENIHRVFTNLLSNAEKFTGEDAAIRVQARRASESRVEVRVSDNGVGIPAEELGQVFDRFYRSQRTSSPRFGGTGIGLSLVREILEAHGCTVRAESPGGQGTTIVLTLPLATGPAGPPARPAAAAPRPAERPRGGATILVIDDDPDVHDLLRSILKDTGDRVVSASSGEEGLKIAATGDFDLVFLDLTMEGMDGTEVLAHLRREERNRYTPVYVVTARADEGSLAEARAAGAQGLLVKPFTIAEVRQAISDVMSGGEPRRQSGRLPPVT
jgi:PAS domain S-box-containing protein